MMGDSGGARDWAFGLRRRLVRHVLVWGLVGPLAAGSGVSWAASPSSSSAPKAGSHRVARQEAVQSIPWDAVDEATRDRLRQVTKPGSIFRRLPTQVFPCDPELFDFMLEHPEVLVNVWEVMGISKVTMTRTGPGLYDAADGAGTRARLRVVHRTQDMRIVLADGVYEGPAFPKPIGGSCVLILRSAYVQETDGRDYITVRLDAFIDLDQVGIELLAKTFQPWIGRIADYNFSETVAFVGSLSRTAEVNPAGVQRLALRLNKVDPELRGRFAELSLAIADHAVRRAAEADGAVARLARLPASAEIRGEN